MFPHILTFWAASQPRELPVQRNRWICK